MVTKRISARKTKQQNTILGIISVMAVIAIIAIIVVAVNINNANRKAEELFTTDDSKYVISYYMNEPEEIDVPSVEETADNGIEDSNVNYHHISPTVIHNIYFHDGTNITGLKVYYEFENNAAAQEAFDTYYNSLGESGLGTIEVDDKYIVLTSVESEYRGLTLKDIRQWDEASNPTTDSAEAPADTETTETTEQSTETTEQSTETTE